MNLEVPLHLYPPYAKRLILNDEITATDLLRNPIHILFSSTFTLITSTMILTSIQYTDNRTTDSVSRALYTQHNLDESFQVMPTATRRYRRNTLPLMYGQHEYPLPPKQLHDSDPPLLLSSLPLEILQEIFLWCIPPRPSHIEYFYPTLYMSGCSSQVAPLLLCQVCKLWRHLALTLPQLWTSLDVYVSMGKSRPSLSLANLWLARSGALPLSLGLFQQNESNDNRIAAGEILDLYKHYIHRWSTIHFDLTGPRYCRLLTSQQRSAPMLKRFRMQTYYRIYEEEEKDLFGIFDVVPLLSHLIVSRIPDLNLFGETTVNIPWSQLVSMSLDYVPSAGAGLHLFVKCPNLVDCSFKIDAISGPLSVTPVLPKLSSLVINIGFEQIAFFLENVTLPGLTRITFYVRGPLDQYGWPQNAFGAFFKRSGCHLLHFEIHDTGMKPDDFTDCLSNPSLQSLERIVVEDRRDWTWDPFVTDVAVNLLTCSSLIHESKPPTPTIEGAEGAEGVVKESSRSCYLPNLESVTFRGGCLWTVDGLVADMVESRWKFHRDQVRRLKRVNLELLSSHVEDFRRLKEFCSEGLELDLSFR